MRGIFLEGLPFDLDTACPISISWQTSVEPQITTSSLVTEDDAEGKDEVFDYLKRRYWETLYLPECLAPVENLCADLLRVRRDPPQGTFNKTDVACDSGTNLEHLDEKMEGNQALRRGVEGNPVGFPQSSLHKQQEIPSEKPKLQLDEASTRKKRKRDLDDGPATRTRSPLHHLLLTIPQLERKHRHGVAGILSRFTSHYYGLSHPAKIKTPKQRTLGTGTTLPLEDSKAEDYFSLPEMGILENAIRTRYTSARAEDDMVALHRSIDAEVDQWYQETIALKLRQAAQKAEQPESAEQASQRQDEQPQNTRGGHAMTQCPDVVAKKEEMMASVMMAKVKSLREQLERREVLLQVILLLVINHLYPPITDLDTGDDDVAAEDDMHVDDLGTDYRTRKAKKKKKKSREPSASTKEEFPAGTTPPVRRKRRTSVTVGTQNEDREDYHAPDPAAMLELFADRITLWQAIGVGSLLGFDSKANSGITDTSNSMDFEITRDTDDHRILCTSRPAEPRNARLALPSITSMEEWDWIQKFCVCIIERHFIDINRKFCESFHLKVFGEAVASAETDVQQLQATDNYDVASDASAGGRERSLSRAASVTSVTSRANSRPEPSLSAESSFSTSGDQYGHSSFENTLSRKLSVNGTGHGNSLPRAKSSASSSQLFKNRQVGFSRTNSSYLSATANGSVSIVMGKRKTMIVPIPPNKTPRAEGKVSGDSSTTRKNVVMGNRRSVSGGEDSPRFQSNFQPPGPATLAFATPSKPRANQLTARGSSNYTYARDTSLKDQSANMQAQDISSGKASGSGMADHAASFVAETPAVTDGRRMNLDSQVLGRNTSFSKTSKALWEHQRNSESRILKTPFVTENLETDDLADFMVDTDEEDEVPISYGMLEGRFSSNIVASSRGTQGDQEVQEVPETPMKAH